MIKLSLLIMMGFFTEALQFSGFFVCLFEVFLLCFVVIFAVVVFLFVFCEFLVLFCFFLNGKFLHLSTGIVWIYLQKAMALFLLERARLLTEILKQTLKYFIVEKEYHNSSA